MSKVKIHVTQEDIDNGKCQNPTACAVAQALKRKFPEADKILVMLGCAEIQLTGDTFKIFKHSRACDRFINNFDAEKPVKPSTFVFTEYASFKWSLFA